jgi:ATP-binding cassette subfamily B protein
LPDYISKIVDIGIMQKGVADAVPEKMSDESFEDLKLFLSSDEIKTVDKSFSKKYAVYILKKISNKEREKLSNMLFPAELMLSMGNEEIKKESAIFQTSVGEFDTKKIAALLKSGAIKKKDLLKERDEFQEKIIAFGDSVKTQIQSFFVQNEYKKVNIKISDIQFNYIVSTGLIMILFAFLSFFSAILVCLLAGRLGSKVSMKIRSRLFNSILSFSGEEMSNFGTSSLITRGTNDITQVQNLLIMLLRIVLYAPILGIGATIMMIRKSTGLEWIIPIGLAILLIILVFFVRLTFPKFTKMQMFLDKLNLISREILTGISVIRAFNKQKEEEKRFSKANQDIYKTQLFTTTSLSMIFPIIMFLMEAVSVAIVFFGAYRIDQGDLLIGNMMAFLSYAMMVFMSFVILSIIFVMLPRANVAARRIDAVIKTRPKIIDKRATELLDKNNFRGEVSFENVYFRFPDAKEDLISDINVVFEKGKTTAIIGGTGSGKSTLMKLIPRLFDITGGSIKIDRADIRDISQKKLRDLISFASQKAKIFSGTVRSNISFSEYGENDKRIETAINIAQADDFIRNEKAGLKKIITQGGQNLSGGQKQRLSIARAVAKDSLIYIFDDCFSALDYKTDSNLRKALKEKMADKTVIIVAQRISTIMNADKIIFMSDGKIVAMGEHRELMNSSPDYLELAKSQLSEKELYG